MASRQDLEQVLRESYAARQRNDIDGIMKHFTSDARFAIAGSAQASPVAMRVGGAPAVRASLEHLIKAFLMPECRIISILIDGDRAAVHWRPKVQSATTGETVETEICDLIEFRDGKIASFLEFCDTAAAARLAGPG